MLSEGIKQLALQASMKAVQEELGERLGYSPSAIYAWRRGEHLPEPAVIEQLARIFVAEGQADRRWINAFLEKANYGPPSAVAALKRELFGETADAAGYITEDRDGDAGVNSAAARGDTLFLGAVRRWGNSFFRWPEASTHDRSSWAGMALYTLRVLTGKITPGGALVVLVGLALWLLTYWLVTPILQWPLLDAGPRQLACLKYAAATLVVPLIVGIATRPDRIEAFALPTVRARATLWFLQLTGALVGFYVFSFVAIGVAMGWYYLGRPSLPPGAAGVLVAVPLFMSYVVARRIPADRYEMFEGKLRPHPADRFFLVVFSLAGPLTALFLYAFYPLLADRAVAPIAILAAAILVALSEYRKRAAKPGVK